MPALFHGLSAFPITPMDREGRVLAEDLAVLLDRLVAAEVDSIGLLGSTGSYMYLQRSERLRAIEAGSATGTASAIGSSASSRDSSSGTVPTCPAR